MIGRNAISNGERFVQADTNRNQPIIGDAHSGAAIMTTRIAAQVSNNGTEPQIRWLALPPSKLIQMLVSRRLMRCDTTTATKVTNGISTTAVSSFDNTTSVSVMGRERQNRMLLSLRSA